MPTGLYSDRGSVARSLNEAVPIYETATLNVVQTDAVVIAETRDHVEKRDVIIVDTVCTIRWNYDSDTTGRSVKTTIQFHESHITERFAYEPSGTGYTGLSALSDDLAYIEGQLTMGSEKIDYGPDPALTLPRPDFAEISADKEFKYQLTTDISNFRIG